MKKYLPIIVLVAGVLVVFGVFFMNKKASPEPALPEIQEEEESAPELPNDQKPLVSLIPRSDGHWLKLSVQGVNKVPGATSVEYLLSYEVPGKPSQGVPGVVKLTGVNFIERDLLLGSESSGKYRYDDGVEKGQLVLKFRGDNKKLLGKLTTDFHIQSKTDTFTSIDGKFSFKLAKPVTKGYYVTINTLGVPEGVKGEIKDGPYGLFSSESLKLSGSVKLGEGVVWKYEGGKWVKASTSGDIGIFVSTSE